MYFVYICPSCGNSLSMCLAALLSVFLLHIVLWCVLSKVVFEETALHGWEPWLLYSTVLWLVQKVDIVFVFLPYWSNILCCNIGNAVLTLFLPVSEGLNHSCESWWAISMLSCRCLSVPICFLLFLQIPGLENIWKQWPRYFTISFPVPPLFYHVPCFSKAIL